MYVTYVVLCGSARAFHGDGTSPEQKSCLQTRNICYVKLLVGTQAYCMCFYISEAVKNHVIILLYRDSSAKRNPDR